MLAITLVSPITTPAACVESCLCTPSNFKLISTTFDNLSSLSIWSLNALSDLIDSERVKGLEGLKGIKFVFAAKKSSKNNSKWFKV